LVGAGWPWRGGRQERSRRETPVHSSEFYTAHKNRRATTMGQFNCPIELTVTKEKGKTIDDDDDNHTEQQKQVLEAIATWTMAV
jgi:hypothetical protein